jgi:hypothetical protein
VAVDLAAPAAGPRSRARALARVAALPAGAILAGLIAISTLARTLVAWAQATPIYFPDEYLYSTLARSIAESGRPLVRDAPAHFPALLEPLLAAPFWLAGDVDFAYRLTQAQNALAMSLAAVPVFLLARRLGLERGFALGCAGVAVAAPGLFYASFVLADPIGYPLALGAVYAGVCALERATPRAQVAFVALSALATFARLQYAVLPLAFFAAAVVLERGRVRRLEPLRLSLALLTLSLAGIVAVGPERLLGVYAGLLELDLRPGTLLRWVVVDAMLLAYSAGIVLVPGALGGLAVALARPRRRAEGAFAAITVVLTILVLAEAALIAQLASSTYQERYLFLVVPLVVPAFGLYLQRGAPRRRWTAVIAALLLLVTVRVPLTGYTAADLRLDSPLLFAFQRLEQLVGQIDAALVVAAVAGLFCVAGVCATLSRRTAAAAIALTLGTLVATSAGAASWAHTKAEQARGLYLNEERAWVDADARGAVLLHTPGSSRDLAFEHLFWNRSIRHVLLLADAHPIDAYATERVRIARDGRLLLAAGAVRDPLLVSNYAVAAEFADAVRVGRGAGLELWQPRGTPRLAMLVGGLYLDGWLARSGWIRVWPEETGFVRGTLRLPLSMPEYGVVMRLRLTAPGFVRVVETLPGGSHVVEIPISARGAWTLRFRGERPLALPDGRLISVLGARPTFEPSRR